MEILNYLLSLLKDPLTFLSDFISSHGTLTYGLLFLIVFVETGLIVMPLLPGDSLLFAVGVIASSTGKIDVSIVIPLLIIAALLGDNVNYFVGKYFSNYIKSRDRILFLKKSHITQTEEFYEKNGPKTVILARFVPIVRTVAPFIAGTGSMNYAKYLTYCILGAILWVTSITLLGYYLGTNDWVKLNFEKIVLGIVAFSVVPMIYGLLKSRNSIKA